MAQEAAKGQIETPDYGAQISFLEQNSEWGKNEEKNEKRTNFFIFHKILLDFGTKMVFFFW